MTMERNRLHLMHGTVFYSDEQEVIYNDDKTRTVKHWPWPVEPTKFCEMDIENLKRHAYAYFEDREHVFRDYPSLRDFIIELIQRLNIKHEHQTASTTDELQES